MCTINAADMTIGSVSCPAKSLLCTVCEKLNIGDSVWPYQYTIRLRYRSNVIKRTYAAAAEEIGWNVAVVDAGMREIDSTTSKLQLIQVLSEETGQLATVTSPELLDGAGHKVDRSGQTGGSGQPTLLVFQAYKTATFPNWFTSEPGNNVPPPNNGGNE